jgi:hypothetical protein
MNLTKSIPKKLVDAVLWALPTAVVTYFLTLVPSLAAAQQRPGGSGSGGSGRHVPKVSPILDFPGSQYAVFVVSVLLGGVVIWMVILVITGIGSAVQAFRSNDPDGNPGKHVAGAFAAIVVIGICFAFPAFINGWTDKLSQVG